MSNGLLNLNKPVGPTSFQMIARLRRLTGVRKMGHAGTLDPLASGVLPICVGKAVRLSEYFMSVDKVYQAEITFGVRTSTDDAEGEVISRETVNFSREQVAEALTFFVGAQEQVPPQFAAIKVAGKPMYQLARRGQVVEARPRPIHIERLTLLDWQSPRAQVEVACSKGTYIRALARDLGERLGCGAHLSALTRMRCGSFALSDSITLATLEQSVDWRDYLLPMDYGLQGWPAVYLTQTETQRILHGLAVEHAAPFGASTSSALHLRAYDHTGQFIAVLTIDAARQTLRPEKVFAADTAEER